MKVHPNSAWSQSKIFEYLDRAKTPIRISCNDSDGYPMICSMWFFHQDGVIWAASHKNSYIIKALSKSPKIGFEVATNEYPYYGVRGKANINLLDDSSANILEKLIDKYLEGTNTKLSSWLLSRKKDEYSIEICPTVLNSWDFSERMERK